MLSPLNLLLITAMACVVMLFVLGSLARSRIPGVRHWTAANVLAFVSLILFACRGVAPDLLSIELANGLLAAAISAILVGFRRFYALRVPARLLAAGLLLTVLGLSAFRHLVDSMAARIVIVSAFHSIACFAIAITVAPPIESEQRKYPYLFTKAASLLLGTGHAIRGLVYATGLDVLASAQEATLLNVVFLSIGVLVLPVLTLGATMMVQDRMMLEAESAANRDFLTGAWSRRAFFAFAEKEMARVARYRHPLALLVLDVDHFKRINDNHGHAAGDQVLVDIARRVATVIRGVDYFARLGGEEFAALLPETGAATAHTVAERLRSALEEPAGISGLKSPRPVPGYTVSIGVAQMLPDESFSQFLERADSALYKAKASGRNLVISV